MPISGIERPMSPPGTGKEALEAEAAVLGSILLDNEGFAYKAARNAIKYTSCFYSERHRLVWKALVEMKAYDIPINYITLCEKLRRPIVKGEIDASFITTLTDAVPTSAHCEHYANIVAENHRIRGFTKSIIEAESKINQGENFTEVKNELLGKISSLHTEQQVAEPTDSEIIRELINKSPEESGGYSWGVKELDERLGGIQDKNIIILAGRTSHGKTTLALQLAQEWAFFGYKVFYQSVESSKHSLLYRRISRMSGLPIQQISRGDKFNLEKSIDYKTYLRLVTIAREKIINFEENLIVKSRRGLTPEEVVLNIQTINEVCGGLDFYILDHFHDVRLLGKDKSEGGNALALIASTCINLNICPVILCQCNRYMDHRDEGEPQLSDIQEYGKIEQIADIVLFVYYKHQKTRSEIDKNTNRLVIAKNRDGATGNVDLPYWPDVFTFGELPANLKDVYFKNKQGGR